MSDPIKLNITQAGILAFFEAEENQIRLSLKTIRCSSANFTSVPGDPHTSLPNILAESYIATSGTSAATNSLRFVTVISSGVEIAVNSIGLYTDDGILFAVASAPVGALFKVYPGVSFTATFGLTLQPKILENVVVTLDQNTALAYSMILDHEKHDNPHPQYATKTQLTDLKTEIKNTYPKILTGGVVAGGLNMMDLSKFISDDLRDGKYAIHITPENNFGTWSIERDEKTFTCNVSGVNGAGYNGNINWHVIQLSGSSQDISGEVVYLSGTADILVIPGQTKHFIIVGAGGGGGAGVHQDQTNQANISGKSGGITRASIGSVLLAEAGGGEPGLFGWWDNGSAWRAGSPGVGGVVEIGTSATDLITILNQSNGNPGISARWNKPGGASVSPREAYGKGGDGGNGRGNNDDGWAGGGGSGAFVEFTYTNNSTTNKIITIQVGAAGVGGLGSTEARTGKDGMGGVVVVKNAVTD